MAKIGILKENQLNESRVSMNHNAVETLISRTKHKVFVASEAGLLSGIENEKYIDVGAKVLESNKEVIRECDIIVKIGKPSLEELEHFKENQILFCFLNASSDPEYAKKLADKKITAIGYELIYDEQNDNYPILATMSELVGKVCYSIGSNLLSSENGKGILLGGLGSTSRSKVVIFGGGNAGRAFMKLADNAGSRVVVFETDLNLAQKINAERPHVETMYPFKHLIQKEIKNADLVLGATFNGKKKVNKLLKEYMIKGMEPKSVIIDLTHECGGICDTTKYKPNIKNHILTRHNVLHYFVPNVATFVPATATSALAAPILISLIEYLITSFNGIENEKFENATAVKKGEIADWISLDEELENIEYRKRIEKLVDHKDENDYDLFSMLDDDNNSFENQEDYNSSIHNEVEDVLSDPYEIKKTTNLKTEFKDIDKLIKSKQETFGMDAFEDDDFLEELDDED